MIVRRYVVKDMPEAVLSIRKDLGKDAVILSSKKIRVRKWLGLAWQTRLEVTAAVGGDIPLHKDSVRATHQPAASQGQAVTTMPNPRELASVNSIVPATEQANEDANFDAALTQAFGAYRQTSSALQNPSLELADIYSELKTLKSLVQQSVASGPRVDALDSSARTEAISFLRGQGLDETDAMRWVEEAMLALGEPSEVGELIQSVIHVMRERLGALSQPVSIENTSRIVAFVGPTGVGKTTTIAKIAALHVLAGQKRVGLLTTDTFRIAAVQQLQTYADILDIPFVVAEDDRVIAQRLEALAHCDLILVDTAGRNFKNPTNVASTEQILRRLEPDETILVVSLTAKPSDADHLVESCQSFSINKLLFTKLDETDTIGVVPRLTLKYNLPISYVTTGQNVPDDIDIVSIDTLMQRWMDVEVSARE